MNLTPIHFFRLCFLQGAALFFSWNIFLQAAEAPKTSAELFQTTQVWNVHLTFTPEQWKAIEPATVQGPGGGGGNHGPGGFDPSARMAPAFLQAGDRDQDKNLSSGEWEALEKLWFQQWSNGKDNISLDALGEAAGKSLMGQGQGPGPGGGNGMGGIPKGTDFPQVHAAIDFNGITFADVAVRYKGNNTYMRSRNSLKRSFKIDLNKYVKGQKIGEVSTINLHSNVADPGWMNEVLSHQLYREAGVPAPRSAYARIYVTVPGLHDNEYFGLYSVVENIDNAFLKDRFKSKEGALFKPSMSDLFHYAGDDWNKYKEAYDPKGEVSSAQSQRVIEFSKLVAEASDADFAAKAGTYLDLEKFARYMAVTVWLSTLDSILALGHNYYLYLNPASNKFEVLPWDLDQSFGQFGMGGGDQAALNILKPWQGQKHFLERVYALPEFQAFYRKELEKMSTTLFTADHVAAEVDKIAVAIRPAVTDESADKAKSFETLAAGESIPRPDERPPGFNPAGQGTAGNGQPAGGPGPDRQGGSRTMGSIKSFVTARDKSVQEQLKGQQTAQASEQGGPGGGFPGGGGPGRMFGQIFSGFDTNKDGLLSAAEFSAGFAGWFRVWDVDKNGKLSVEEIQAGLKSKLPSGPPMQGDHP